MKKIVNDPAEATQDTLAGFAAAHDDLVVLHADPLFFTRAAAPVRGTVALVSGGGSGHEPLHAGFVGEGMLDAAVPGALFSSPTPDAIAAATLAVDSGAGVLHVVKNYTGDVLNFLMAAELAEAAGVLVASVLVDDDVAIRDSTWTAGRRGVAGTVLVEKIAGAAAARGDDLPTVKAIAERVVAAVRSMGVALRAPILPHTGEPSFQLAEDQMEFGVGIHGEPGRQTMRLVKADELVALLLDAVTGDLPFGPGDETLLLVNGLGGTPESELYVAYHYARRYLRDKGIRVTRSLVGAYVTSLDMAGISITLLKLDDELRDLWDAPVHTVALRWQA